MLLHSRLHVISYSASGTCIFRVTTPSTVAAVLHGIDHSAVGVEGAEETPHNDASSETRGERGAQRWA
jgi:hypothetical protein